jgi:dihydroorotate dehydrogenase (NAD+) catalytic subunit
MLNQVRKAVDVPLIGIGGIVNARDALEFLMTGASAFQIGTANFIKSDCAAGILKGISDYLDKRGVDLKDFIGTLRCG